MFSYHLSPNKFLLSQNIFFLYNCYNCFKMSLYQPMKPATLEKKPHKSNTSPCTPKLVKYNKHCTLITIRPYMLFVPVMCDHRKLTRGLTLSFHFHAPHWKLSLWFNSSHCLHGTLPTIYEKEAVFACQAGTPWIRLPWTFAYTSTAALQKSTRVLSIFINVI